ncbi:MAG: thioesterase domain-containing protein [Pirellulales bacterium]
MAANFAETADRWWSSTSAAATPPRLRLFLFPYAGGGARVFHGWRDDFPADIDLRLLQMPGRDLRHREPGLSSMPAAAEAIVESLRPLIAADLPFAFFGYSLGGLIAFETARRLRALGLPQPKRLLIAAGPAPHCEHARDPLVHRMTDDELVHELRRFKGTPEIVLQTPELARAPAAGHSRRLLHSRKLPLLRRAAAEHSDLRVRRPLRRRSLPGRARRLERPHLGRLPNAVPPRRSLLPQDGTAPTGRPDRA